ncbi:melanoregulin [Fundulus heteroclitus]|uniref:melanoregulin n=1 Tax=Fundulus heteroclitus TaxID=8078 RepID=UPI00165B8F07|nr:melanoregulin [Fundulus heteroclitus]
MGANFTLCCCHYYLMQNREEKKAILRMRSTSRSGPPEHVSSDSSDSDTEEESLFGPQRLDTQQRDNQQSRGLTVDGWADPNRPEGSLIRCGSDRELQAFINMRDRADKATEEWEKLNYDIHTLRYARREVRSRWKKILLQLGYQCEVDSLLCMNRQSHFSPNQEHLDKAADLLKQLLDHSSLFPRGTGHHNIYLHVMDRLVSLDSADDFIKLAKEKYPKKEG